MAQRELTINAKLKTSGMKGQLQQVVRSTSAVQTFAFGRGTSAVTGALSRLTPVGGVIAAVGLMKAAFTKLVDSVQTAEVAFSNFAKRAPQIADEYGRYKVKKEAEEGGFKNTEGYAESYKRAERDVNRFGQEIEDGWREMRKKFTYEELRQIQTKGVKKTLSEWVIQGDHEGNWANKKLWELTKEYDPITASINKKLAQDKTLEGSLAALDKTADQYEKNRKDMDMYGRLLDTAAKRMVTTLDSPQIGLDSMSQKGLYMSNFMQNVATANPQLRKMDEQTDILRAIRDSLINGNMGGLQ